MLGTLLVLIPGLFHRGSLLKGGCGYSVGEQVTPRCESKEEYGVIESGAGF